MIAKLQQTGWVPGRPTFWIFFCLLASYLFEVIKQMTNTAPVLAQTVIDKYIEDLPELPNKSYSCR